MAQFTADKYTTTIKKEADVYSDFKNNIQIHPGKKDLLRVTNENSVKQSIKNLLMTNYFERPFQPFLGANLKALLFENATPTLADRTKDAIIRCIKTFEPRAILMDVVVTLTPDENAMYAQIVFATRTNPKPITLDVILNRVR